MPMPWTCRHSEPAFRAVLADVKDCTGLVSDNLACTALDGVLQVFRRRVTPAQGIAFASLLPSTLRAIFVAGRDIDAPPLPFAARAAMAREARALRPHHDLTPDTAIAAVARAVRRSLDQRKLDRLLETFPPGARAFWQVAADDPADLRRRNR